MTRRLAWIAMLVAIAALAIYLRASQTYATSWAGGQLVPYDTDPYYQLRRLELLRAGDFPPGVGDQFVNAPSRFDCPWPIGLPILLDGIVRVATIGRAPSRHQIEAIVAFAIPVLGALTPLLLVVVLRQFGRAVAWLGGIAAAALPSARMAGHYARVDHHVLEPAAALGMFALVFKSPSARAWRDVLVGMLVGAACAFTLDLTFVFCVVLGGMGVLFALVKRPLPVNPPMVVGLAAGIAAASLGDLAIGAPRALAVDLRLAIAVAFAAGLLVKRDDRWPWVALGVAIVYGAVRGAAVGMWLAAPTDTVTRTMDEALPPWTFVTVPQALFHLFPVAIALLVLGFDKRRRDLPLLAFLVGITLLNVAQSKYQALRALLESCGWALLPSLLALALPAGWKLLRALVVPAVALVVVSISVILLPPNPQMAQVAIARGLAELAARLPALADPAYATPRAHPATMTLAHPVDGVRFDYLAHVAVPSLPFWGQPTSLMQYEETLALLRGPYGPALERRLDDWRVRYILVTKPRPQLGLYEQLRIALGSEHPGWPATATVRLLADAGTARLFERVAGARVHGHA
ncbi:MAG: putative oligosaccharyl transferase, partial [bacterium]|nr:putative oligosaccharyl transferase [bacterium]